MNPVLELSASFTKTKPAANLTLFSNIPVISRGSAEVFSASNKASITSTYSNTHSFFDLHSDAAGAGIA